MDVSEIFYEEIWNKFIADSCVVELTGWITTIDSDLFLLENNFSDPYADSKKIEISDRSIICVLREKISPLGGRSFVFHRAKIVGVLMKTPSLKIEVRDLYVNIEHDNGELVRISVEDTDVKRAKEKYGDYLIRDAIKSDDWLDYYL